MPQTTTMTQDTLEQPAEAPISRRMLLAGSAGLVGAAAVAGAPALAQRTHGRRLADPDRGNHNPRSVPA